MAAQVLIELVPDISKIESAFDELAKSGKIDDSAAKGFKEGNDELSRRKTILKDLATAVGATDTAQKGELKTINDLKKALGPLADDFLKGVADGFKEVAKESGVSNKQLQASIDGAKKLEKSEESLRAEKKRLTEQIAKLIIEGKKESAMYRELIARAGEIDDATKDASDAISRTGSDTRGLDNALLAARGLTAGFAVAQGASALLGDENEDLQLVLLKVNAAMTILNGLQEIQNLLRSEYIKTMIASVRTQVINNASIALENGLQSKSVVVRGLATAAQYALNLAMSLNPIGIFAAALAATIIVVSNYTDNIREAAEATTALNAAVQSANDGLRAEMDVLDRRGKERLAQMDAEGKKRSEMIQEEVRQDRVKAQLVVNEINNIDKVIAANKYQVTGDKEATKALEEATARRIELRKQLDEANSDGRIKELNYIKQVKEEDKKAAEEAKQQAEKNSAAYLKLIERKLNNEKYAVMQQLLLVEKGSEEELQLKIKLVEAERNLELNNENITANQKKYINTKAAQEINEINKQIAIKHLDFNKTTYEEDLENFIIVEKAKTDASVEGLKKLRDAQSKLKNQRRVQGGEDPDKIELERLESERSEIHQTALDGRFASYEEYEAALTDNTAAQEQKRFEIEQEAAERRKALWRDVTDRTIQYASEALNGHFEGERQQRKATYDQAIELLDAERDATLNSKNLTSSQKLNIERQYAARERLLKKQAALDERKAQVQQAIAAGILAAIQALATVTPTIPAGIIAAAFAVGYATQRVHQIESTPTGYAKGTKSARKGMAWVGEEGPELMEFKGGEKVYTHKESMTIYNNWSDKLAANIPTANAELLSNHRVDSGGNIDYDRLGKAVAKHLPAPVALHNSFDENGFRSYVESGNTRTEYKNSKYKA